MAFPLAALAAIPGVIDFTRSIFAGKQAKADEAKLEAEASAMKVPESIMDVYNKNLARYSPNAYQSAEYNKGLRDTLATQVKSISAAREAGARGLIGNIGAIQGMTNRSLQDVAARAERAQGENLRQLTGAAGALAQQENAIRDFKRRLEMQKAAAGAQRQNFLGQSALKSFTNAATLGVYGGTR